MSQAGEDLIVAVYKFFRSKGYSPIGAAYMVGSLLQESNLNPNILQPDGAGYGVAQWNDPEHAKEVLARLMKEKKASAKKIAELKAAMKATSKRELIKFSKKNGREYNTLAAQLHFVVQQNTKVTKLFKTAKTKAEAEAAVKAFEHYGIEGSHRFSNGETIYKNVWVINQKTGKGQELPGQAGTGLGGQVAPDATEELDGVLQQLPPEKKGKPSDPSPGDLANALAGNFGGLPPGGSAGGCLPAMPPPFSGIPGVGTPDNKEKPPQQGQVQKHPHPIPQVTVTTKPQPVPVKTVTQTPGWFPQWFNLFAVKTTETKVTTTEKKKIPDPSVVDFVGNTPKYADLPKKTSITAKLCLEMQKNWKNSFDKGNQSHEHGGSIVKKPDGTLDLVNQTPGTSSDFAPNTKVDAKDIYVGTFHTHPYGKNDGDWDGANIGFSGGDLATLDDYNEQVSIVQSGNYRYVLIKTQESTNSLVNADIEKEYQKVFKAEYDLLKKKKGISLGEAARLAAEKAITEFSRTNKYGFYKGTNCSNLTKVN